MSNIMEPMVYTSGVTSAEASSLFLIECEDGYPGEYGEIIEENFAIVYEPG